MNCVNNRCEQTRQMDRHIQCICHQQIPSRPLFGLRGKNYTNPKLMTKTLSNVLAWNIWDIHNVCTQNVCPTQIFIVSHHR